MSKSCHRISSIRRETGSVADLTLVCEPFLGGYRQEFPGALLEELTDLSVVSVACPLGGHDRLATAIRSAWSAELPAAGRSSLTADGRIRIFSMSPDQFFVLAWDGTGLSADSVHGMLGNTGYYTDQSDSWVALRLTGPVAAAALERICPIDLDPAIFTPGSTARTAMEHMGAVIHKLDEDDFVLLSASSSARSFLHAVETSIRNIS